MSEAKSGACWKSEIPHVAALMRIALAPAAPSHPHLRRLLNLTPELLIALPCDADLDVVRRRAVQAGMREAAGDHRVAPDIAVPIAPVGAMVDAAAHVGAMPAVHLGERQSPLWTGRCLINA